MKRWLSGIFFVITACLPLATAHAWFLQPGMAQQCSFRSFSAGTGGATGKWVRVGISNDGSKMSTGNRNGSKIFVSSDGGATWTQKGTSLTYNVISLTPDGTKQVAAVYGGNLYTSTDSGNTWTSRDSSRNWVGTAISDDGTKMVASVYNGTLYTSTNSGISWTSRATTRNWQSVTSSSDGTKLAALANGGFLYTSTDSGVNWTQRATTQNWWSLGGSSDGTILAASTDGGQVYTSTDSGVTWNAVPDLGVAAWRGIDVSSDGSIMVIVSSGASGRVYRSTDGGATWWWLKSLADADYYGVSLSGDGQTMAATVMSGNVLTEKCDYTNRHDAAATDDIPQKITCAGNSIGGYCWYKGASAASCDTTCASHGACDATGTINYAGSGGSDANCKLVLDNLDSTSYTIGAAPGSPTYGCATASGHPYRATNTTTCAASTAGITRACACTQ